MKTEMTELWDDVMNAERKNVSEDSNHRIIEQSYAIFSQLIKTFHKEQGPHV